MSQGIIWSMLELTDDKQFYGEAGTETNPYGIEDVFDFCAIKNDEDKETTYYQLVNNVDFNDHPVYKNGITSANNIIDANKSVLNGDGKSIRNIVFYKTTQANASVFTLKKIHNCKFENLVNACIETAHKLFRVSDFNNCSFYILFQNSIFTAWTYTYTTFSDCTFNIAGTASTNMNLNGLTFLRCHINFDNFTAPGKFYSAYYNIFMYPYFDHVYFTGKLHIVGASNDFQLHETSSYSAEAGTMRNIYWCVEMSDSSPQKSYLKTNNANAISFINKDLVKDITVSNGTNFYVLTDAQCKDPAYLISIGFPVIGV